MIVKYSCGCLALHTTQPVSSGTGASTTLVYCLDACDRGRDDHGGLHLYPRPSLLVSAEAGERTWEAVPADEAGVILGKLGRLVSDGYRGRAIAASLRFLQDHDGG
jgi:hypothetical protein